MRYHVLDREPPWADYPDEDPWTEAIDDPDRREVSRVQAARPFVVIGDEIHLGQHGMAHLDMFDRIPEGAITGIVNPHHDVYVYDQHPGVDLIKQTVRKHIGEPPSWTLSSRFPYGDAQEEARDRPVAAWFDSSRFDEQWRPWAWRPGDPGKAVVKDGVPYAWSDAPGAPEWHHDEVLDELGVPWHEETEEFEGLPSMFVIHPDGTVEQFGPMDSDRDDAEPLRNHLRDLGAEGQAWTLSAVGHNLSWRPGTVGKGFVDDHGVVYTFTTSGGRWNLYSHADLARAVGVDMAPGTAVVITPGGAVDGSPDAAKQVAAADPGLHPFEAEGSWDRFSFDLDEADHHLDWDPASGLPGKGLVAEGALYTWTTYGEDERPWHDEYVRKHHLGRPSSVFYIDPAGGVFPMNDEDVDSDDVDLIEEVDPRLVVGDPGEWTLARAATLVV